MDPLSAPKQPLTDKQPLTVKILKAHQCSKLEKATEGASGYDISIVERLRIGSGQIKMCPTGIYLDIPSGYEGQVRSRSGLAAKYGIHVLNSPGTIDSDYRGEVKIILHNAGEDPHTFEPGDRIAQIVFAKVEHGTFETVDKLSDSKRSDSGFGSTGV